MEPWSLGQGAHLGQGCLSSGQSLGGRGLVGKEKVCQPVPGLSPGLLCPADGNTGPGLPLATAPVSPALNFPRMMGPRPRARLPSPAGLCFQSGSCCSWRLGARTASPLLSEKARAVNYEGRRPLSLQVI